MDEQLAKAKKRKNKKKQVGHKEELATRARIAIMEDKMAMEDKEEENMSDVPHHSKGGVAESRELTPSDDEHSDLTPPEDTPMAMKVLPPVCGLCSQLQPQLKIKIPLMMKATEKAMVKSTTVNQPPVAPKPIPWPRPIPPKNPNLKNSKEAHISSAPQGAEPGKGDNDMPEADNLAVQMTNKQGKITTLASDEEDKESREYDNADGGTKHKDNEDANLEDNSKQESEDKMPVDAQTVRKKLAKRSRSIVVSDHLMPQ